VACLKLWLLSLLLPHCCCSTTSKRTTTALAAVPAAVLHWLLVEPVHSACALYSASEQLVVTVSVSCIVMCGNVSHVCFLTMLKTFKVMSKYVGIPVHWHLRTCVVLVTRLSDNSWILVTAACTSNEPLCVHILNTINAVTEFVRAVVHALLFCCAVLLLFNTGTHNSVCTYVLWLLTSKHKRASTYSNDKRVDEH
jgi:hypothetical protein